MTFDLSRDGEGRWGLLTLDADALGRFGRSLTVVAADRRLPSQLDLAPDGTAELVVDLANAGAGALALAPAQDAGPPGQIAVDHVREYQGQETCRLQTPAGTWYYHLAGAGFASLVDRDGADWLSFRPWGGSDGLYRGIPNLAHPENVFHPGADTCVTDPVRVGPLRATLVSRSRGGAWACRWHIYPDHAELTVLKVGHPYWLLYEGTPAGSLDEARGFCLWSDGTRRPLSERWNTVLPDPKWIAFGVEGTPRTLWVQSHAAENAGCRDSYWPMEGNMTVFGFGRLDLEKFMSHTPARFTVGLSETTHHADLSEAVRRATEVVRLGVAEAHIRA